MSQVSVGGIEIRVTVRCWECGATYSFWWNSLGRYPVRKSLKKAGWFQTTREKKKVWVCPLSD